MRYLASVVVAITVAIVVVGAQTYPDTIDGHVAAAKAAAGSDYAAIATRLCTAPAPPAPRPATLATPRATGAPARDTTAPAFDRRDWTPK